MVAAKKADFDAIAERFGIRNITARLIANRLITARELSGEQCNERTIDAYLNGDESMLGDPHGLADIEKGAGIILERIRSGARIRVIGDYDVDGICSSFILVSGLRLFGADVDYRLPDRVKDGYGLSVKLVDEALDAGIDTIITCDNGIAAYDQIQHARQKGMTVVVTDHHEVPFETASEGTDTGNDGSDGSMALEGSRKEILPPANAVIDPKRKDDSSPFREICGAVVAYKFLQVLADQSALVSEAEGNFGGGASGFPTKEELTDFFSEMLIFAGIATVCDVMELRDENRIIVRKSLELISGCRNRGLKALINVTGLDARAMSCYQYGFVIGPCLNATGRLDLASRALSLFFTEDENEAAAIAQDLKDLNDSRKDLTRQGVDSASRLVLDSSGEGGLPKVLVIYLPEAHESIAGIIAGRIKEKFYRPTIVLTDAGDGGIKGSGRSIECYDMFEELSKCKDLFTKFGGHKMAAGLSLPRENLEELRRRLCDNCALTDEDFIPVLHLDMQMPFKAIDMDLVREFARLEPFGNGNPKPLFAQKDVRLLSGRILGRNQNVGKYRISDESGIIYDMMYFGDIPKWHEFLRERFGDDRVRDLYEGYTDGSMRIMIAYYPDINSYQGRESLQLVMSDYS
jgi:single-stranded-DNA-specific exonuclease